MAVKIIKLKNVVVPFPLKIKWNAEKQDELNRLLDEAEAELDKHEEG